MPAGHGRRVPGLGRRSELRWIAGVLILALLAFFLSLGRMPATWQSLSHTVHATLRPAYALVTQAGADLVYIELGMIAGGLALGLGVFRTGLLAFLALLTYASFIQLRFVACAILLLLTVLALRQR